MGAVPKHRPSTKRRGQRRKMQQLKRKQTKHHSVPFHQRSLVTTLKALFKNE